MPKITNIVFQELNFKINEIIFTFDHDSQREREMLFRLVFASLCPSQRPITSKEQFSRYVTEKILETFGINDIRHLIKDKPIILICEFDDSNYNFGYEISRKSKFIQTIKLPKKQLKNYQLHSISRNDDLLTYSLSFLSMVDTYYSCFSYFDYFSLMKLSGLATKLKNPELTIVELNQAIEKELGGKITLKNSDFYLENKKQITPVALLSQKERKLATWSCLLQSIDFSSEDILFLETKIEHPIESDILTFLIKKGVQIITSA